MAANRDEPSKYVTLVSNDGFEFVLLREATVVSPTIKAMLRDDRQWREATTGRFLEKVAEYFQYWYKNRDKLDVPDMDIPVEICLELLVAADYLGLDMCSSRTA
ncbi:Skp1 family protein [Cercophora scortea]|uniref:Elongin-C n=1 Tax=Cercophora scortea TaxID=314031 RepID=A0AAE0M624_9PEZI|nr:Skp1 family protein [Cercophora scortea]